MRSALSSPPRSVPPGLRARRRRIALAWAGIAGPLLFALTFLAQDAVRYDDLNPVREPVSALVVGPGGWVQEASFVVLGVLTMAHAVGLNAAMRRTPGGVVGPTALFLTGLGNVLGVVFPLRAATDGTVYDPGGHVVAGTLFFIGSPVALILLSLRMRCDPRWHGLARWTLIDGLLLAVAAVLMIALVLPQDAPLHPLAGLLQRLLVLVLIFPPRVAVAVRMLTVSRGS